jgi:hypothetical protein
MKKNYFVLFMLLFLFSCSSEELSDTQETIATTTGSSSNIQDEIPNEMEDTPEALT